MKKLIRFCCCLVAAGAAFGASGAELAEGYRQLEWLYINGASWTLSGYTPSDTDRIEMTVRLQEDAYAQIPLFCACGTAAGQDVVQCRVTHDWGKSTTLCFRRNNGNEVALEVKTKWFRPCTVVFDGAALKGSCDDAVCELTEGSFTPGSELAFFAQHTLGPNLKSTSKVTTCNNVNYCRYYFYSVRIYSADGTLVREYVPAEDLTAAEDKTRYGLFETQTQGFYANCGSKAFGAPRYLRVTPDAPGGGDGQSWASAMTLDEALAVANGTTYKSCAIMLKTGTYCPAQQLEITQDVSMCGGYAGTADDAFSDANSVSVIDGQDQLNTLVNISHGADYREDFRRLEFRSAARCAVSKSVQYKTAGMMAFSDCRFVGNGCSADADYGGSGCGIYFSGMPENLGSGSCLWVSNCVFAGNAYNKTSDRKMVYGGRAVAISNLGGGAQFLDCQFVTNGIAWTQPLAGDAPSSSTAGAGVVLSTSSPTVMERCVFRGNRYIADANASVVKFENTQKTVSWRVALTNCLFVGNEGVAPAQARLTSAPNGVVVIKDTVRGTASDVVNCTFAYNTVDTTAGSAGLCIADGLVKVRNSIFYGNLIAPSGLYGSDLRLTASTAVCDLDYSLFGGTTSSNLYAVGGATLDIQSHVIAGDPQFNSTFADFEKLLVITNKTNEATKLRDFAADDATRDAAVALDVHVSSGTSPAVDTGDESPWYNEPDPNGEHINLGAYGNTSEAHTTDAVQPEIVDGSLAVSFPYETSQPHVSFEMGGEGDYMSAVAEILWTTNGTDWVSYETLTGLGNGDVVDQDLLICFVQGSDLQVKVSVSASGAQTRVAVLSTKVTYPCPPSWGKGGGAGVLHVHAGATGDGSGRDWFNATTTMPPDTASLPYGTEEVWVAADSGDLVKGVTYEFTSPIVIRGGFACSECSASERAPGAMTLLDCEDDIETCVQFRNGETVHISTKITLDGFDFARAKMNGLYCRIGPIGEVDVLNCAFTANGLTGDQWYNTNGGNGGRAIYTFPSFYQGGGIFVCSNCTFRGNAAFVTGATTWVGQQGGSAAVTVKSQKSAMFADCTFTTNGIAWKKPIGVMDIVDMCGGAALYVTDTPLSLTRCEFRANRGIAGDDTYERAIVALANTVSSRPWTCGITNCLFVGNELPSRSAAFTSLASGALSINDTTRQRTAEIVNCTFAYNIANSTNAAAGLSVKAGDVKVRNSVFYGNRQISTATQGSDIFVTKAGASADVDYSFVTSLEDANVAMVEDATLTFGDNMKTGNPKFTTPIAAFDSLVSTCKIGTFDTLVFQPDAATLAGVMALDVHEKRRSPLIDTGDPASEWANEPKPNGSRVNMGAYGNTSEAALSSKGLMLLVK